jgi:hypothetical protein
VCSAEALRKERYPLGGEEFADEFRVELADGGALEASQNVGSSECFCDEPASVSAGFHDHVYQQLHGMNSETRSSVVVCPSGKQNVIHPART